MNQSEKMEKWNEIIATANDGDPSYSFRLFSGLLDAECTKDDGGKN